VIARDSGTFFLFNWIFLSGGGVVVWFGDGPLVKANKRSRVWRKYKNILASLLFFGKNQKDFRGGGCCLGTGIDEENVGLPA
jgi:hypothetical protein